MLYEHYSVSGQKYLGQLKFHIFGKICWSTIDKPQGICTKQAAIWND